MTVLGVDGCPKGWVGIENDDGDLSIEVKESFARLLGEVDDLERVFVDVPIGLPSSDRRQCDIAARGLLGSRRNSVFFTPSRAAVDEYLSRVDSGYPVGPEDAYRDASEANREAIGDGLSRQAWNIVPKIAELDIYLRDDLNRNGWVIESHPECCFFGLNHDQPLAYSKSSRIGLAQRRAILARVNDGTEEVYAEALSRYYRKQVGRDDVLDAIALALAASQLDEHVRLPMEDTPVDEEELPMRIVYAGARLEEMFAEYRDDPV